MGAATTRALIDLILSIDRVITALGGDEIGPSGGDPGELDGSLDRFRAGV